MTSIINSNQVVLVFSAFWLCLPLFVYLINGRLLGSRELSYIAIRTLIFYPIPSLLLEPRALKAIGFNSTEDILDELSSGASSGVVLINRAILIFLLSFIGLLVRSKLRFFNEQRLSLGVPFALLLLINGGLLTLDFSVRNALYSSIYLILIFFGDIDFSGLRKIIREILILYFYSSLFLIVFSPGVSTFTDGSWTGIFDNPNGFTVVSAFVFLAILLLRSNIGGRLKLMEIFNLSLIFLVVVFSGSRNALLCLLLVAVIWSVHHYRLRLFFCFMVGFFVLFLVVFFDSVSSVNFIELTSNRLLVWEYAVSNWFDSPITGVGPDFYSIENKSKSFPQELIFASSSYSAFIDYLVLFGVIGFTAFFWFIYSLYKNMKSFNYSLLPFLLVLIIPNLFESYFSPPKMTIHNAIYLLIFLMTVSSGSFRRRQHALDPDVKDKL